MSIPRATPPGPRRRQDGPADPVHSITSAPEPLADDQARRMTRYLVQMGIRIVCFLGAIFLADGWLRWVLVVAAVVLPYSAVLFANAGRDRVSYGTSPVTPAAHAQLPAPTGPVSGPAAGPGAGRVVEHQDDHQDDDPDGDDDRHDEGTR